MFAGLESFYVTNDHFFHFDNDILRVLGSFLLKDVLRSNVVFDGSAAVVAAQGLKVSNGINKDFKGIKVRHCCQYSYSQ